MNIKHIYISTLLAFLCNTATADWVVKETVDEMTDEVSYLAADIKGQGYVGVACHQKEIIAIIDPSRPLGSAVKTSKFMYRIDSNKAVSSSGTVSAHMMILGAKGHNVKERDTLITALKNGSESAKFKFTDFLGNTLHEQFTLANAKAAIEEVEDKCKK